MPSVRNIQDVAALQLCCGCGVCAYISPDEIEMIDVLAHGRRPRFKHGHAGDVRSEEALCACPAIELSHSLNRETSDLIRELLPAWGPVREVWEGYASDPAIRFAGSSGGAATALSLYCIEKGGMHGVLHITARDDVPYLNRTTLSTGREELLAATGSRYAPASPFDWLHLVERAPQPCVFIGKPCDVAGVEKARSLREELDEKVGLTIALFCAGSPSTKGTLEMLQAMGVDDPSSVISLRYRGNGWPGKAAVEFRDGGTIRTRELTYEESWGEILEKHRPWRCRLCADHTGEFADVAVGDPWYRDISAGESGRSLILARSERGCRAVQQAMEAGYLTLERAEASVLPASQPGLQSGRGAVWGRLTTLAVLGMPRPRYNGMPMFRFWWRDLGIMEKLRSTLGTARRVFQRGLAKRCTMDRFHPTLIDPPDVAAPPFDDLTGD